jgi:transposase
MAPTLLTDDLWAVIALLVPSEPPKPNSGRPRLADRRALGAILFVLKYGIGWPARPLEIGFGTGLQYIEYSLIMQDGMRP